MKRITSILVFLAAVTVASVSCTQKTEDYSDLQGKYAPSITMDPIYVMLPGTSMALTVKAESVDDAVSGTPMKVSFTVNPDLVTTYNNAHDSSGVLFPAEAYDLDGGEAIIPRFGRASSSVSLKISCSGMEEDQLYVLPVVIDKFSGEGIASTDDASAVYVLMRKAHVEPGKGSGTKDDPWIISEVDDLKDMSLKLIEDQTVYFKMTKDIDASEIENWLPLNSASPYKLKVDFNGNGHKISNLTSKSTQYPSMFGVLYGSVYDLTFENAYMEGSSAAGVVGGYLGTGSLGCTVTNVHATGSTVVCTGANGAGGLGGRASQATIEKCSFEGTVSAPKKNYIGGLLGYDAGDGVVISNCYTSGSVTASQRAGGIVGGFIKAKAAMYNCYSTMTVMADFGIGGIAGHCCLDMKSGNADVAKPGNVFEHCIAWNDKVAANTVGDDSTFSHYSVGAIVGYNSIYNTCTGCVRKPDLNFASYSNQEVLCDQPDASESAPQSVGVSASYSYPYHGKAAAAGKTLSTVARELGWPADVWDLSGDVPVFKK